MGEKSTGEKADIPAGMSRHSRGLQRIKQVFDSAGGNLSAVRAPVEAFVLEVFFVCYSPVSDFLSVKKSFFLSLEQEVRV